MKVSGHELRKHYKSLETEELLELRGRGTLTELASSVMEEVLASRGVTSKQRPMTLHPSPQLRVSRGFAYAVAVLTTFAVALLVKSCTD